MQDTFESWRKSVDDNDREYPPSDEQENYNSLSLLETAVFIVALIIVFCLMFL